MKVVIPSAGIGSRLNEITINYNKSLVRLGDLPVISKILFSYPKNFNFHIILGYKKQSLKEYIKLAHPDLKITFSEVKNFSTKDGSLTKSLNATLRFIDQPFFFHANDTLVLDKNFHKNINTDTMYVSDNVRDTINYASIKIKKNTVEQIFLKSKKNKYLNSYIGLAYIKDYMLFKEIIRSDKTGLGELQYFMQLQKKINVKKVKKWFDTGNQKKLLESKNFFKDKKNILDKNDQLIFFVKNNVIKSFSNKKIITERFRRAKLLEGFVPKLRKKTNYFYSYNLIDGKIFSDTKNKKKIFRKLLYFLIKNFWKKYYLKNNDKRNFELKCRKFYYHKTIKRINHFHASNKIKDKSEVINGSLVPKLTTLLKKIDWNWLSQGVPVNFHGDLHFENIIVKKNKFKFLDWRENFSGILNYGDLYYDLAKINHGFIINHDLISKNKFEIKLREAKTFKIHEDKDLKKDFMIFLIKNKLDVKKVEIITALIYLNIAPLHHYPYNFFLYYLGKYHLNNLLN